MQGVVISDSFCSKSSMSFVLKTTPKPVFLTISSAAPTILLSITGVPLFNAASTTSPHVSLIEGRIKTGSYDAKDGTKRYTTEVIASKVQFLSKASGQVENNTAGFSDEFGTEEDHGDLPF